jgi:hypothetical protein
MPSYLGDIQKAIQKHEEENATRTTKLAPTGSQSRS